MLQLPPSTFLLGRQVLAEVQCDFFTVGYVIHCDIVGYVETFSFTINTRVFGVFYLTETNR